MKLFNVAMALLALALLAACGGDDDDVVVATRTPAPGTATPGSTAAGTPGTAAATPGTAAATRPSSQFFDFSRATTTGSGLAYIDINQGTGDRPRPDQVVSVHYTGKLAATGVVFESTEGSQPASFPLTRVIKGFSEGIQSMRQGGKRILYIPAALAYGASPPPGSGIPVNADLIFEVELVGVK